MKIYYSKHKIVENFNVNLEAEAVNEVKSDIRF